MKYQELIKLIEEKYKKEKEVSLVGTINKDAWEFAIPIIKELMQKEIIKKIDCWWNKIIKERNPTNSFEKDKRKHCFILDYEDIKNIKDSFNNKMKVANKLHSKQKSNSTKLDDIKGRKDEN